MIPLQYGYLAFAVALFIPWFFLYLKRPDERREMLVMSFTLGFASVITGYLWWTHDWWRPLTVTRTVVGVEDFIIGFLSGGIMASAYEWWMRKRHYHPHRLEGAFQLPAWSLLFLLAAITGSLFWTFHYTSFVASSIAMIIVWVYMVGRRPDLFWDSLASGALMTSIVFLFAYLPALLLVPGLVENTWPYPTLSGITFLTYPIEEFIFWILAGFIFGPLYEYWKHERLRTI